MRSALTIKLIALTLALLITTEASAIKLKIKRPTGADTTVALAVVADSETATARIATSAASKPSLTVSGRDARLVVQKDNDALPVVGAVFKGGKVYALATAKSKGLCADGQALGLTSFKKSTKKDQSIKLKLDNADSYAYVSSIAGVEDWKTKLKTYLDKNVTSELGADCVPAGNAASAGFGSVAQDASIRTLEAEDGDKDADGLVDEFDVDDDNDSVLDNYDPDNLPLTESSFRIFTNLKVGIESTINKNAIPSLTDEQIDEVVAGTQSMAIEVKTENSSGKAAELDCGSLSYCAAGGTGRTSVGNHEFPEDQDDDADGLGQIEKGGTGDFQLITGAPTSEIGSGDTLIQTIADGTSGDVEETYLASLGFAFYSTPAIQTMVLNPGDGTEATYTPTYPVANNGQGTVSNPFSVQPDGSGDVNLRITAFRPQRKGISGAGEADTIDVGNSLIVIDIPNGPSTGGGATSGPGGCPITSYSESDADLSTSGDALLDAQADFDSSTDTDGDGNKTVTFTVNITDCLAKNGSIDTLDSGESLKVDLQFKNSVGDNAAQAFYIGRP